ncbi:MAG: hypothetical protein ACE5R4_11555 [Armatimonadota bacterium]
MPSQEAHPQPPPQAKACDYPPRHQPDHHHREVHPVSPDAPQDNPFEPFDRSQLELRPLRERRHDMDLSDVLPLDCPASFEHRDLPTIAERIVQARKKGAEVIVMMGAHVVKQALSRHVIDLLERGIITHVGMNGAVPIHDFELALVGATTESVADYITTGEFGLWTDTGGINEAAARAHQEGIGFGQALGRMIAEGDFPHKDISILAAAYRLGIPATVHVGIGYDIVHEHPNCDGAAVGAASYQDFLILTQTITRLEGGVLLNYGTAVMGPEVYLKALAMARNAARQQGREIRHFTTAVFDLVDLPEDYHTEAPKHEPAYYYRPYKTILVRTVAEGGESFYIQGDHRETLPTLRRLILERP